MTPFWKNEDWLAVLLGAVAIAGVLLGARPAMPRFAWASDSDVRSALARNAAAIDSLLLDASIHSEAGMSAALRALREAGGDRKKAEEAVKALRAAAGACRDKGLKDRANRLAREIPAGAHPSAVLSGANLWNAGKIGLLFLALSAVGVRLLGGNLLRYAPGFGVVFLLACLAQFVAENATVKYWGLEYVLFALLLGLLVSNTAGVPAWLKEAVRTEFFIKTGLVILGAGILFPEILRAGGRGILQALGVVFAVWYACWWLCRRLRVDAELSVMLSTAVSICGVSAAIAACGAIQGDRKKLSYVTSLVLLVAAPMMVLMPWMVRAFGIPEAVGGAWIGGTLDTTGSVVAAGGLVGDKAMSTGVIVKLSQNVLIGVAAFLLSIWWTVRQGGAAGGRPSARVIWERFPKFVLGFLVASLAFSFLLRPEAVEQTKGTLSGLRTFGFALAFVSIGLETRFAELFKLEGGRPAAAFVGAQAFNLAWTLVLAYLLFR